MLGDWVGWVKKKKQQQHADCSKWACESKVNNCLFKPGPHQPLLCWSETHMHTAPIHLHLSRLNSWFRRHLLSPAALTRLLCAENGQPSPEVKSKSAKADLLAIADSPLVVSMLISANHVCKSNKYYLKKSSWLKFLLNFEQISLSVLQIV